MHNNTANYVSRLRVRVHSIPVLLVNLLMLLSSA